MKSDASTLPPAAGKRVLRDRWGEPVDNVPAAAPVSVTREDLIAWLAELYATRGERHYGEGVNQRQHGLQAARLAEQEGADGALVIAALLHDIGHLLHKQGEDAAGRGIDTRHEAMGAGWLRRFFGEAVCEPIRLHVEAKRYLCAVESGYFEGLSPASKLSLSLQGGIMTPDEAESFIALPWAREAVRLRRWDEGAKVPGQTTPDFAHFEGHIAAALAA